MLRRLASPELGAWPGRVVSLAAVCMCTSRPRAKQSLGQNFLSDDAVAREIVGALRDADTGDGGVRVLELGPGQGALTGHLAAAYPHMTAYEIDRRMVSLLSERLPHVDVRMEDMLRLDLSAEAAGRGGRLAVISNTPFYLTSPLLFKLLGEIDAVSTAVLTMQREVADKVLSPPRNKEYGILSVMLQLFGAPERTLEIPPEAFSPAPKCHVSALRLCLDSTPGSTADAPLTASARAKLLGLLKLAFEQRRKMLRRSLKPLLSSAATTPPESWLSLRPEQLEPLQFVELAEMIFGPGIDDGAQPGARADGRRQQQGPYPAWKPYKAGFSRPAERDD